LILHGRIIEQAIDRGLTASFHKEIVVVPGAIPLAMVRKRSIAPDGGARGPVLLVHGFGQNRYAWHLPSRSLVNHLAHQGYDVFNLDLRGHGRSRQMGARMSHGVADYIKEDLPLAVEEVRRHSGQRPVFLVGHSLGGLVSYAAAPDLTGAIAGVATIGSPYHFTRGSRSLGALRIFFRAMSLAGVTPMNVPLFMTPWGVFMRQTRRLAESPFYPIPLRGFHVGALEPEVFEEHLRLAFDRGSIAELASLFEWANARRFGGSGSDFAERFEKLDVPLLVVAGANDDLAPPASVRPAYARSVSADKTYRAVPLGHIDLLVGREAPKLTWQVLSDWLSARAPSA
jgi:alpha-beta hydrolase superfamily lysophospholipase